MKKLLKVVIITLCSSFLNLLNAQGLVAHDFNDNDMGPFVSCTTQRPNFTRVVNRRLRTYWEQTSYTNRRSTRGAEACADPVVNGIGYLTYKHCWMGFTINIDQDYMGANYRGVGSLAQIFGFDDARGQSSWSALLEIEDGNLMWIDRRGIGRSRAEVVVYENFPKGRDMDIVVHAVLSDNNTGLAEVFVNGELEYSAYNIRLGMGEFDSNDRQTNQSYTEFKIGQYNHSNAAANEIRIVDYDNISWYDGVDGYDIVNPNKNETPAPTSTGGNVVHITKRNARGFALDGNRGAANRQNIYLWRENDNNVNQQWIEIDRGNGYYSYQKNNTNFCIDGGRNGSNGQNVYLWECNNNNRNQHWQKVDAGGGAFRLIKRNATGFALDGGSGGVNGQNVALYNSSARSQNLEWFITPVGRSGKSLDTIDAEEIIIYPNPVESITTIQGAANTTVHIYDMNGAVVLTANIASDNEQIDLTTLSQGVYYTQVDGINGRTVIKLLKM